MFFGFDIYSVLKICSLFLTQVNSEGFVFLHMFLKIDSPAVLSTTRGGQKSKKLDSELPDSIFPFYCLSGATKKISAPSLKFFIPP